VIPSEVEVAQREICREHNSAFSPADGGLKCGFAMSTESMRPINGLRHPPEGDTTGWYIWCGDAFSHANDFFAPMHTAHIYEERPEIAKFLGLAPGHRFRLADDYVDVWFDPELLIIRSSESKRDAKELKADS
jgi:hypothetical protein